jgi:hypothetical protein
MNHFRLRVRAAAFAVLMAPLIGAQNYERAVALGRTLNASEAARIESSLTANARDLDARARLLGYYAAKASQDAVARGGRLRQIEWLIQNEPGSRILRDLAARLSPADFAEPYGAYRDSIRAAWREQVKQHPNDVIVIENAWASVGRLEFPSYTPIVSSEEYTSGATSIEYLRRLRALEPGDPEWALDLGGIEAMACVRAARPDASPDAKQLAVLILPELLKTTDVAVVGLAGASLYQGRNVPRQQLAEALLRRAAQLNPKNLAWQRALDSTSVPLPATLQELQMSDLWPGGVAPAFEAPREAVHVSADALKLAVVMDSDGHRVIGIEAEMPPTSIGAGCSVAFDVLVGPDGQVRNLQVAAISRLNIPFVAAERDGLRQVHYQPILVNGNPVSAVTQITRTCPKETPVAPKQ